MNLSRFRLSPLALALLAVVGCNQSPSAATDGGAKAQAAASAISPAATPAQSNLLAAQIADTLEACSYDGKPVQFGMGGQPPRDCRDMIAQVMSFTGLPQNFDVTEANVPNAAAAILLDKQKVPRRVIAFNPDFMELVRRETGGNRWSPVSIMAHEVGHHLAGHTIQPGGSQPPTELEADKFSGFVLYKMGASLDDSAAALKALVAPTVPAGSTHPPRGARVAAIKEGWEQACRQIGRADCASGKPPGDAPALATTATPVTSGAGVPVPSAQPVATPALPSDKAPAVAPASPRAQQAPAATPATLTLPKPDPAAIPSKGTQFIYDEVGLLDPATVAKFEQQFREHAEKEGVEIVTLVARDLHGMSPDQYAWTMLRQLRVGKLDVGNGAVLVYVPAQKLFGMAFGPGVKLRMKDYMDNYVDGARGFYASGHDWCVKHGRCNDEWTDSFMTSADHVRRDTRFQDWAVHYQSLGDMQKVAAAEIEQALSLKDTKVRRKIVQFSGKIVNLDPDVNADRPTINEPHLESVGKAVHVESDDGLTVIVYLDPETEGLMPGGKLVAGGKYRFTAREVDVSHNPKDTMGVDLLSYVQL